MFTKECGLGDPERTAKKPWLVKVGRETWLPETPRDILLSGCPADDLRTIPPLPWTVNLRAERLGRGRGAQGEPNPYRQILSLRAPGPGNHKDELAELPLPHAPSGCFSGWGGARRKAGGQGR